MGWLRQVPTFLLADDFPVQIHLSTDLTTGLCKFFKYNDGYKLVLCGRWYMNISWPLMANPRLEQKSSLPSSPGQHDSTVVEKKVNASATVSYLLYIQCSPGLPDLVYLQLRHSSKSAVKSEKSCINM